MTNKQTYIEMCKHDATIPVFSQPWWLNAASEHNAWDVAIELDGGVPAAAMPYFLKRRAGFSAITMPPLTQVLGPHLVRREFATENDRLSAEKKMFGGLVSQLPACDYVYFQMHYRYTNWLPFYWAGFQQTTRYTYFLPDTSDIEVVAKAFEHSKRKDIKKALRHVTVSMDLGAAEFYENHVHTLRKQGRKIAYSFELFRRIHDAAYANSCGRTIYAKDAQGNLHAALFVIWAPEGAYDLISTIDPEFRTVGAASLLVYEMIRYTSAFTRRFDFEGSMNEGIEASFRRFGAIQAPYLAIRKVNSRLLRVREVMLAALR